MYGGPRSYVCSDATDCLSPQEHEWIFSYKFKLSQAVQYHTWSVFIKPVLRSGLAALPIRPTVLKTITTFHHKILCSILKLSQYSTVVPLYFLLGCG